MDNYFRVIAAKSMFIFHYTSVLGQTKYLVMAYTIYFLD